MPRKFANLTRQPIIKWVSKIFQLIGMFTGVPPAPHRADREHLPRRLIPGDCRIPGELRCDRVDSSLQGLRLPTSDLDRRTDDAMLFSTGTCAFRSSFGLGDEISLTRYPKCQPHCIRNATIPGGPGRGFMGLQISWKTWR